MATLHWCLPISLPPRVKGWLKEQQNHLKSYETRVRGLENGIKNLQKERDTVQHKVDEEENRYGRGIDVKVKEWIEMVDSIISEYEDFNGDKRHECAVCDLFSSGYLPKPGIRYRLSRKANDITGKVNGLLQMSKHETFSHWLGPPSMAAFFSNVGYENFPSRNETMKKIKAALDDPSVRMIGLHGLSGMGKTTLVKEVAKEALEAKMFDVVIMANVTRNPDTRKIQGQIADMLGIKLEDESDTVRAVHIQKRLKNEKENTLIILDNLWAKLDFNMLGIPSENDDGDGQKNLKEGKSSGAHSMIKTEKYPSAFNMKKPEKLLGASNKKKTEETLSRYKGCKVLLISEAKQVLLSQMDGKGNSIFSLEVLKEKEAETLFKKKAGIGDNNSVFEKLAAQIANKCNGLPMSIVTTARALKNQNRSVWEDVHRQLERQKLTRAPEFSTKFSYDLLENEELKYTFLLCARMGHDALVMDLVKYCIGLGFLQGIYTVREARDRVQALVGKLKESGLLSDSYSSDSFTMQDIVRSAALSIASKEMHVFTMTKGKLDEWPDKNKLKRYTVISLQHCHIIEKFPESINCHRLRIFHLDNNDPHLKIPDNLFKGMKELRVLILIGIHLSPLPSSIRCLKELRMLCLERCMLGEQLHIIGELKKLRILSLSGSDIEQLPAKLKQLTKLQIFDISNCSKLTEIPSNVISSLISLEELYMRNTLIQWKVEGQTNQSENANLSELRHLNQLTTLDIQIPNVAHLLENLFFHKLYSYKIVIGDLNSYLELEFMMPEKYEVSRFLAIQLKAGFDIHSQKGIKMLFERVENLLLGDLNGVRDIFYELNLKGFPYLKHLSIVSNHDIQSLINSEDSQHPEKAFPKLESLYLYNLKSFNKICFCRLLAPSFGKLKVIKIKLCGQLKNVFLVSAVRLLTVLEAIEVSECNSLKEIVHAETQSNTNEIELLKFPELRALTLKSLSEFIGFYLISSTGETTELFHEKVEVSKLERMELSLIQIDKIWSDQPSLSSYFQNLKHLDVNGCWNLKYLLSFSMANRLVNLQSLFVSECENMECIFPQRQVSDAKMKGSIFPSLKNIKLSSMKSLSEIWNSEFPLDSFGKLDTLIIEECDKFVNVFPCYMVALFRSLCNLRVTNCKSMKAIFSLDDKKRDARDVTNLQDVHLEALPNLEHVWKWNKGQEGILNFKNLQKIWVHECHSLENIFSVPVAVHLKNLEYLVVWDCARLKEIVAKGEGSTIPFVFPKLTTIKFSELPELKSFYPEAHKLSCPALNDLSIEHCDKLEPFRKETADALFPEEVINKLKSMQIESWRVKSSRSNMDTGKGNYRRDNLEELHLSRLMNTEILYSFLHRNPNLISLSLNNCFFEELVPLGRPPEIQNLGVVPKLKSLKLIDLPDLEKIGFERDKVLQMIEFLILKNCPRLVIIGPSSVSFTHLTNLEVVNCEKLTHLMAPSTAKSLVQLTTMKVIKCESMKEIVSEQVNEEENAGKIDIVFRQLKSLELVSMKNLKSFCNSKSCVFEFPSLEKLVVNACPKMENFSEEVKSTPILQKIYVVHEKEKKRWYWKGNLKATIQKMFEEKNFFEGMDELSVSDHLELQKFWHGEVGLQSNWFYSLETLTLENCEFELCAIPSNILPYLKSLKELIVRDCNNIKVIFDMNDTEIMGTAFQLKKLTLQRLSELTYVWEKNHQGILSFQNLHEVVVSGCKNLKTLFPAVLAKNLKKLEKLEIEYCDELLEIVGKEAEGTENFVFPRLTWLDLFWLPQLTYFYPETFTLECPALNHLYVLYCYQLEVFQSQQEAHPEGEGQGSTSNNTQPLFSDLNAISHLKELALDWKDISVLRFGQFTQGLQYLNKLFMYFDKDYENEKSALPFKILEKAPNLELMGIYDCYNLEIFRTQKPKIGEDGMLGHLKTLYLTELYELQSIGSEDSSWLNTICDKVHQLYVFQCPRLTTFVHSAVSFSYLKSLDITLCHGLEYLFTYSAAKKLRHLEEMYVHDCELMKEIVAKEQDETTPEGIKFERLEKIALESLSSLECFYSGNATLQLPSLIKVVIQECPMMKIFSQGSIHAESFRGIQASFDSNEELVFHDDLNTTVKRQFLHQGHLVVGDYPELEVIWLGVEPVPNRSFSNLKSLVVEGCGFLSNAILSSHLLPFLRKLEELKVRNCNSVKAIFDVDMGPAASPLHLRLKKLTLEVLPTLKHVWNEDPQRSLSLPFLEEVFVEECRSITSLFPASVDKDRLQKLDVRNCEGLVEIVAKDEATTKGAIEELVIFPSLALLRLWNLPNLKCIYPEIHIQEWPMLTELNVYNCQKLKVFVTDFQNCPESHPEGQDSLPTNQQALFSADKVTPHLEELSLNKEDAMMIEQGQLHVDLQKLKFLKLLCFDDESDVFPYDFLSKVPLPSIEKIGVVDSTFKEIFPSQRPDIDYTKILSQLKGLELNSLSVLNSIGLEHSWMDPFIQNLETLDVLVCDCLTNLAPSTVSFSHLTELNVDNCDGLKYLFTSSAAKSLVVLKKMYINNCKSLEKIVAEEENEPGDEEEEEPDNEAEDEPDDEEEEEPVNEEEEEPVNEEEKEPNDEEEEELVNEEEEELVNEAEDEPDDEEEEEPVNEEEEEPVNEEEKEPNDEEEVEPVNEEEEEPINEEEDEPDDEEEGEPDGEEEGEPDDEGEDEPVNEEEKEPVNEEEEEPNDEEEDEPVDEEEEEPINVEEDEPGNGEEEEPDDEEEEDEQDDKEEEEPVNEEGKEPNDEEEEEPVNEAEDEPDDKEEEEPVNEEEKEPVNEEEKEPNDEEEDEPVNEEEEEPINEEEDEPDDEEEGEPDDEEEGEPDDEKEVEPDDEGKDEPVNEEEKEPVTEEEEEPNDEEEDEPDDEEEEEPINVEEDKPGNEEGEEPDDEKEDEPDEGKEEEPDDEEEEDEPDDKVEEEPVNEEEEEPNDEEEDEPDEEEMIFRKLEILSLSSLPKLGTFYTGSSTLNFPSLEEISFTQCHNMKMFSHGDVVIPRSLEGKIDGVYWYGDINIAIKRQFEEGSSLS